MNGYINKPPPMSEIDPRAALVVGTGPPPQITSKPAALSATLAAGNQQIIGPSQFRRALIFGAPVNAPVTVWPEVIGAFGAGIILSQGNNPVLISEEEYG